MSDGCYHCFKSFELLPPWQIRRDPFAALAAAAATVAAAAAAEVLFAAAGVVFSHGLVTRWRSHMFSLQSCCVRVTEEGNAGGGGLSVLG